MIHTYSVIDDTLNGTVDLGILSKQFTGLPFDKITVKNGIIAIHTNEPKTSFDPVVAAHSSSIVTVYEGVVRGAMDFFSTMMVHFAAENVTMGITQAGKTKEAADYLSVVMRYGQSGSLYAVMNEIDTLVSNGVPASLSPFVTSARLTDFKSEVAGYLGL